MEVEERVLPLSEIGESALRSWLKGWYSQDFSWESLKRVEWRAPSRDNPNETETLSLQDYWRFPSIAEARRLLDLTKEGVMEVNLPPERRPQRSLNDSQWGAAVRSLRLSDDELMALGLLLEYEGRLWHVAHLPVFGEDGSPTAIAAESFWLKEKNYRELFAQRIQDSKPQRIQDGDADLGPQTIAQFQGVQFRYGLPFSKGVGGQIAKPSYVYCKDALFYSRQDWSRTRLGKQSNFANTIFLAEVDLSFSQVDSCELYRSIFCGAVQFVRANFVNDADFDMVQFLSFATFTEAVFNGAAQFSKALFCQVAEFSEIDFKSSLFFSNAMFVDDAMFSAKAEALSNDKEVPKRTMLQAKFTDVLFFGYAEFDNKLFTDEVDFARTAFFERAKFYNCTFHPNTTFTPSRFFAVLNKPSFEWLSESNGSQNQEQVLNKVIRISLGDYAEGLRELIEVQIGQRTSKENDEGWFENLEQDFRNLKDAMDRLSATSEKQDFHALELSARLRRSDGTVTILDKMVGYFFRYASDFGRNAARPLLGILMVFLSSLLFSGLMAEGVSSPTKEKPCIFVFSGPHCEFSPLPEHSSPEGLIWRQLIADSAQKTVFPVFRLKSDLAISQKIDQTFPLRSTALRLLQSGFSISFLFLFLLTIRRRFQLG